MSERGNTLANSNVAEEEKPTTTIKTAFIKKKRKKKRNRNVRQTRTTLEEGDLAVDNPEEGQQAAAQDYMWVEKSLVWNIPVSRYTP